MPAKKRIILVAGARPNFMKIAPLFKELNKAGHFTITLVHTGQHYDKKLSKVFFDELKIPKPDINLGVGSGSHAQQTAQVLEKFDAVLEKRGAELVIVVGDVNSTIACALAAAKRGIMVAHVEAGLRSFDWTMPEEINRVVTDSVSDFLFCTEESAIENLKKEGVPDERIHFVGNVMIDTLLANKKIAQSKSKILNELFKDQLKADKKNIPDYAVATLHRASNVDEKGQLSQLISALREVSKFLPVIFPIHPRTKNNLERLNISTQGLKVIEPLGYLDFLQLMSNARMVLTDSGGIQEETTALGIPCLTLRENTERPATIAEGTNSLVGTGKVAIIRAAAKILAKGSKAGVKLKAPARLPQFWDGKAAARIVKILCNKFSSKKAR